MVPPRRAKNNIIATPDSPATIDERGNLVGDPEFVDPSSDDYALENGSPAIDSGVSYDPDGSQANLGAYGGTGSSIWESVGGSSGQPRVGKLLVQPDPVAAGGTISIKFNAWTN